jgi:hypothetical protein
MIGVAQEKTSAWRGFKAGGSASHNWLALTRIGRQASKSDFCVLER